MRGISRFVVFTAMLFVFISCSRLSSVSINQITENPRKYAGRTITISGRVVDGFSLLVVKYFILRDKTGEMVVVTGKPLPKKGEQLSVRGMVEEAFSLGDKQLLVLVEARE
jgi:hypothetical protein